jgi:hypothetical protein
MPWDEEQGTVTRAFDQWRLTEVDIRSFTKLGLKIAKQFYERTWEDLAAAPGDPYGSDLADLFHYAVEGLWPDDFNWMLLAGAVKDAVTAFDVFLEKATDEVLRVHGWSIKPSEHSPNWKHLVRFWKALGTTVNTAEVRRVRDLRNFLTHRRGELRTEGLRKKYQERTEQMQWLVTLPEELVTGAMEDLAGAVRAMDVVAYAYSWGGQPLPRSVGEAISNPR